MLGYLLQENCTAWVDRFILNLAELVEDSLLLIVGHPKFLSIIYSYSSFKIVPTYRSIVFSKCKKKQTPNYPKKTLTQFS